MPSSKSSFSPSLPPASAFARGIAASLADGGHGRVGLAARELQGHGVAHGQRLGAAYERPVGALDERIAPLENAPRREPEQLLLERDRQPAGVVDASHDQVGESLRRRLEPGPRLGDAALERLAETVRGDHAREAVARDAELPAQAGVEPVAEIVHALLPVREQVVDAAEAVALEEGLEHVAQPVE